MKCCPLFPFGLPTLLALAVALSTLPAQTASRAADGFPLIDGDRVVFLGDSITQAGEYITYIDAFLLTRFPDRRFTLINHGISSETISGTSEPDHTPRRPNAHDRFARDVSAWKPDVLVACFGMNDGNYHPFEPTRFDAYKAGIVSLIDKTRQETKAKLFLLTPPPFDPYQRRVGDPKAAHFGYKFPAIDYDVTLDRYSQWLTSEVTNAATVIDVHTALNNHLRRRRVDQVSFFLAGDAVHPGPTGHWLIAQTILRAWNTPETCAEASIDAMTLKASTDAVNDIHNRGGSILATWQSPIPMPIDTRWVRRSLEIEQVNDRLNRYRFKVTGLTEGHYKLLAKLRAEPTDRDIGEFTREQLVAGINLNDYPTFPTVAESQKLFKLLLDTRKADAECWRASLRTDRPLTLDSEPSRESLNAWSEIDALRKPKDVLLKLVPNMK